MTNKHLAKKGLHLNTKGKVRLALNFLKQIRKFWCFAEHLNENPLSFEIIIDTTFETSQLSDTPLCNPSSSDNIVELKQLRNEN